MLPDDDELLEEDEELPEDEEEEELDEELPVAAVRTSVETTPVLRLILRMVALPVSAT